MSEDEPEDAEKSQERRVRGFGNLLLRKVLIAVAIGIPASARADVKLPGLFSEHMVLQRGIGIPVWGWAASGEKITVTFARNVAQTVAGDDGKWKVVLESVEANARPQTLTVTGKNTVTFNDVLVGDVWICSGQSNMGLYLGECDNAPEEVPRAKDPFLRFYTVGGATSINPEDALASNMPGGVRKWVLCEPKEASQFTGVGYFFGRELRRRLDIPIGLISSVEGGSIAQLWTSVEAIRENIHADPEFKVWLEKRNEIVANYPQREAAYVQVKAKYDEDLRRWLAKFVNTPEFVAKRKARDEANKKALAEGKLPLPYPQPSEPSPSEPEAPDKGSHNDYMVGNIFNSIIHPLIPYGIKGVVWYQGESNDKNSKQYRAVFPILITDWRRQWGQGDFPFLFVQLPNINEPAVQPVQPFDKWPGMREAQASALSLPNTGMATTIDVGDPYDVHGRDKLDVGLRLSLVARRVAYGENIVYTGPTYKAMQAQGNRIVIDFNNIGTGLVIGVPPWTPSLKIPPLATELKGFAIAGEDRKWVWAKARIDQDHVVVSSDQAPSPVAVRYGWADNPPCNLYNKQGLPAAPFRTDSWEP